MPTSYYSAVQFVCRPTVVDDPAGKVEILTAQLADFQPEGRHAGVSVEHRERVIGNLEQRNHGLDADAAARWRCRVGSPMMYHGTWIGI